MRFERVPAAAFAPEPRYTETAWGHLSVEFRLDRLTGFRSMRSVWLRPGSTLGQVRRRYRKLTPVGTDRWQSANGLVFSVSFAEPRPRPSSRITEIEYGTCGDF